MKRRPMIAGNWKMHKTCDEAAETATALLKRIRGADDADVMIAPTFTALERVAAALKGSGVFLGAQNLFWEKEGAFTGEISGAMLTSAGCTHVIIGHSERRQYFGETDETVNKRLKAALAAGLCPVLCVGETVNEREAEETFNVLDKQIKNGLDNLFSDDLGTLIIAYEPVWAIGTGKTASREQAQEAHAYVRSLVGNMYGDALAGAMRILYGGSVKPDNAQSLMEMPDIDGALVGGASLTADVFSRIIRFNDE